MPLSRSGILPSRTLAKTLLLAGAALALAACSKQPSEYTTDVKDKSGGQLIVNDADATGVPVTLPETPMTPVPPSEAASTPPAAE